MKTWLLWLMLCCFGPNLYAANIIFLGSWPQVEQVELQRFYQSLPATFSQVAGDLKLAKNYQPLPESPAKLGGVWKQGVYHIPIYDSLQPAIDRIPELQGREKQLWERAIQENHLAFPLQKIKAWLDYLKRELARALALQALEKKPKHLMPEWLHLTGWKQQNVHVPTSWYPNNIGVKSFADARGKNNPKEDLASTIASYFQPPLSLYEDSIRCRMPGKYSFVRRLFPTFAAPLERSIFAENNIHCFYEEVGLTTGLTMKDIYTGEQIDFGLIHPDNLLGFELLYATPGDREISEIAGHLLLRVKLKNNPLAEELGEENPYDIVIALLADSRDFEPGPVPLPIDQCESPPKKPIFQEMSKGFHDLFSALRGLAGFYGSMVQVDSLQYVRHHYATIENRTILRYRLTLTRSQELQLLQRLIRARLNYEKDYYFFTQNCGNLLVELVAEGIGSNDLQSFKPLVSSPNLLLGRMEKLGLIERIYPDFLSTFSTVYKARDWISLRLHKLQQGSPLVDWPKEKLLFHSDEKIRIHALRKLHKAIEPKNQDEIRKILLMFQKTELYFVWKEDGCFTFQTKPKSYARDILREFSSQQLPQVKLDLERSIDQFGLKEQIHLDKKGSPHIGYLSYNFGLHHITNTAKVTNSYNYFKLNLFEQEMADFSYLALGKSASVLLGTFEASWNAEKLQRAKILGLKIRKIKMNLGQVPSLLYGAPKMGIGLSALQFVYEADSFIPRRTRLLEGELYTSLISSDYNQDYWLVAIGLAYVTPWEEGDSISRRLFTTDNLVGIPIRTEGRATFLDQQIRLVAAVESEMFYDDGLPYLQRDGAKLILEWRWHRNWELEPRISLELEQRIETLAHMKAVNKFQEAKLILSLYNW